MKVLVFDDENVRGSLRSVLNEVDAQGDEDFAEPRETRRSGRGRPWLRSVVNAHQTEADEEEDDLPEPELDPSNHSQNYAAGAAPMSSFAHTSDAHYQAVEDAVLQTPRGRWFLAEYLRRHRHNDADRIMSAIDRLESRVAAHQDNALATAVRREVQDIAAIIAQTRRDVATLKIEASGQQFTHATDELDTVVAATERATGDVLASVERLQDIGLRLRGKGVEHTECEAIEAQAITILRACSAQDITGQRISRVVSALRAIEHRVSAILASIPATEHTRSSQPEFTHQPQTRLTPTQETTWVTPAVDRVLRSEGQPEPSFEHSVARSY